MVNKVRLLHFHSASRALLYRLVLPLLSCLVLLISLEEGDSWPLGPSLTDGWIRQGLEVNTSI